MKKIILVLFSILSINCNSKKQINGIYVLTKKTNSFNIVLKLKNNIYSLETISTGLNGVTNGVYILEKKQLKLIPEITQIFKDSLNHIEKYSPFTDTLLFEIKKNRLIPKNKNFPKTLYRFGKVPN